MFFVNCLQNTLLDDTTATRDLSVIGKLQKHNSSISDNTTSTTINTSSGTNNNENVLRQNSLKNDIFRPMFNVSTNQEQLSSQSSYPSVHQHQHRSNHQQQQQSSNDGSAYVNTEYTNRETLLCDVYFTKQQQRQQNHSSIANTSSTNQTLVENRASSALYLNASTLQHHYQHQNQHNTLTKKSSSASPLSTVVRKIPENLVLNNSLSSLKDINAEKQTVQPSPAPSTASGPYIPISECFSGSPKFVVNNIFN